MSSKRRLRRQRERVARLERELLEATAMTDGNKMVGNTGRTSVADLILQRHKYLHPEQQEKDQKPTIQVSKPTTPISTKEKEEVTSASPSLAGEPDPIIASQRHKELIWKEAVQNRDYYLKRQKESKEKHPWFFYVRKEGQYSEFVMLNTEMAQEMLDHIWKEVEGNRHLKNWLKDAYKRDYLADRWIPSDEAIGIDFNNVVYNGRHRLTALVETGKEWPMYITFNCLEEAKFTVDSGAKRNSSEKLRLVLDTKLGNRTTGFCKAVMRGLQTRVRYTESEIAEFAHKWEDLIGWIARNLPAARAEVQAAIAKAYLWYGPELIEPFCARLKDVKFPEDGDPAKALYVALQRHKLNRINQALVAYKKTLAALDALFSKKPITKLYEKEEDIFQWVTPGWELPPRQE